MPSLAAPLAGRSTVSRVSRWQRRATHKAGQGIITLLAALAALTLAFVPPASYLAALHAHEAGALKTQARLAVVELSRHLSQPQAPSDTTKLHKALEALLDQREAVTIRLGDGRVILAGAPASQLAKPLLRRVAAFEPGGGLPGSLEVVRSFRSAVQRAGALLALCSALGLAAFLLLRLLPTRMLRRAIDDAAYLATHDTLTGLPNRTTFSDRLRQALQLAQREGGTVAVLALDLDRFKPLNDVLGPTAGDAVLREVAQRLSQGLRACDTVARLSGNGFAVIQYGAGQPEGAAALATRLNAMVARPFSVNGRQVELTASIGISLGGVGQAGDAAGLSQQAELALFQAKQGTRGSHRFFSPEMNRHLQERRALEQDLRRALAEGELRLVYQPLVYLSSGRISGAEALLRWTRPGHGEVPPASFISVAEEAGLIGPVGTWVIEEACRQAAAWPAPLSVAVNISPLQFRQPGFCGVVEQALRRSGLPPARLELEITEGVWLRDTQETLGTLRSLRALGVRIAMDDFGTGPSSLSYLRRFVFDKIKIDRGFVRDMAEDPNARAIVRAVMGISQTLGIRTNAEGVENDEQAELLRQDGCDEVQGYLFGRPMPPEQFAALATLQAGSRLPGLR